MTILPNNINISTTTSINIIIDIIVNQVSKHIPPTYQGQI